MEEKIRRLINKFYPNCKHPYDIYQDTVCGYLQKHDTVVDIGCGATAPMLCRLAGRSGNMIGIDLVPFQINGVPINLINASATNVPLADATADIVISRSVFEHLPDPSLAFREISRILKYGGHFILLTPNLYDYSTIASKLIPNRYHASIVTRTEGRHEEDVFPTYYRANTSHRIEKLATWAGLQVNSIDHLGQYPCYLTFNPLLFGIGAAYDKLISRYRPLKHLRSWVLAVLEKYQQDEMG